MLTRVLAAVLLIVATGCSAIDINQYADNQPRIDVASYFQGNTRGWGIVQNRSGEVTRQFVVDIVGTVNETGELVLTEDFTWNDGERSRRIWTISETAESTYAGRADDIIGAARGVSAGNALNWKYDMSLEVDGSIWRIHFDDWMFLQDDNVLLNRAMMSKFGLRVGEVTIAFKKITTDRES